MLFGLGVLVVLAFAESYASMWQLWQSANHQHGSLVFPIAVFLIWRQRHALAHVLPTPDARGLLLLLVVLIGWLLARLTGIQLVEHFMALLLIPAVVITAIGFDVARVVFFSLIFLLLATPLADSLVPLLMEMTANISETLLRWSGIPTFRQGQYISLPGGNFVVADVCSGVRYLVTGLMVMSLFGHLNFSGWKKTVLLLIVSSAILILTNGARAYIVMAVASATDMQYLGGRDHVYFGWVLFGLVIMPTMFFAAKYADRDAPSRSSAASSNKTESSPGNTLTVAALVLVMMAVTIRPLQADFGLSAAIAFTVAAIVLLVLAVSRGMRLPKSSAQPIAQQQQRLGIGALATLIVGLLALVATPYVSDSLQRRLDTAAVTLPALPCPVVGEWQQPFLPQFTDPTISNAVTLNCGGENIGLFMAAYGNSQQGAELASSSNYVVPPKLDWYVQNEAVQLGSHSSVIEIQLEAAGHSLIIWYWYNVGDEVLRQPSAIKLAQIFSLLRGTPSGGHVTVLAAPLTGDEKSIRTYLRQVALALLNGQGAQ